MKLKGPILMLLILVFVTGMLLTLSFYINGDEGVVASENRTKLSFIITLLLSFFILLSGTGRWWFPHLWKHNKNSQHKHRERLKQRQRSENNQSRRHHNHRHSHRR
ncbi:MAG: hypothetical protein OEL75_00495 [Kiritimatiellaceae bacterium]|nr:hypothetical protein [Kiritimatiellaceae bacterium]